MFDKLFDAFSNGFLITANIGQKSIQQSSRDDFDSLNLNRDLCYTILKVAIVTDSNGVKTQVCQMRNPWGDFEWKGHWSDQSSLWTKEDRVRFNISIPKNQFDIGEKVKLLGIPAGKEIEDTGIIVAEAIDGRQQVKLSNEKVKNIKLANIVKIEPLQKRRDGLFWVSFEDMKKFFASVLITEINESFEYSWVRCQNEFSLVKVDVQSGGTYTFSVCQRDDPKYDELTEFSKVRMFIVKSDDG